MNRSPGFRSMVLIFALLMVAAAVPVLPQDCTTPGGCVENPDEGGGGGGGGCDYCGRTHCGCSSTLQGFVLVSWNCTCPNPCQQNCFYANP